MLRTAKSLLINENYEDALNAFGSHLLHDTGPRPKSQLMVPLIVGVEAIGVLQLIDSRREQAYGKAHVRLLETLAASLSLALRNVQSFESERARSTELGVINAVQQRSPPNSAPRASSRRSDTSCARCSRNATSSSAATTAGRT